MKTVAVIGSRRRFMLFAKENHLQLDYCGKAIGNDVEYVLANGVNKVLGWQFDDAIRLESNFDEVADEVARRIKKGEHYEEKRSFERRR